MNQQSVYPRWRGFNLVDMFVSDDSIYHDERTPGYFAEKDFRIIRDLGFNFVRLPLSYRIWSKPEDPYHIDESKLQILDKAVEWGDKYDLHLSMGFHRIPGYCVNDDEPVKEPYDLWKDAEALEAAKFQWSVLAERYKAVGGDKLDFNIVNEPYYTIPACRMTEVTHPLIETIHEISPKRPIMLDGAHNGSMPPIESMMLEDNKTVGYSCRGYRPGNITHFGAEWVAETEKPSWPDGGIDSMCGLGKPCGPKELDRYYEMWAALSNIYGVGVMCGEMGCYIHTPHETVLRWFEDMMKILQAHNIGYALWNFKGVFGIMNSHRKDVDYEDFEGYKLDRKLLDILMRY